MKVLFVTDILPNKNHSTVSYHSLIFSNLLKLSGYDVYILSCEDKLVYKKFSKKDKSLNSGIKIKQIFLPRKKIKFLKKLKRFFLLLFRKKLEDYFPRLNNLDILFENINKIKPDFIITFCNYDILLGLLINSYIPKISFITESYESSVKARASITGNWCKILLKKIILELIFLGFRKKIALQFNKIKHPLFTVLYEAEKYFNDGVKGSKFIRCLSPDWKFKYKKPDNKIFRILIFGHKRNTALLIGLRYLANEILPKLESQIKNKYVINIVGKYKLPKYLLKILNSYKSVRIKGFVKNLKNLIRNSNVVLLPTPIALGSRPRAIFSWSAGSCVIGHKSNQDSLPFFKNKYNCLLGNSSDEIVDHILNIKKNPLLRKKIIFNARKTFEKEFSVSKWKKEFTKITKLNLKTF